MSISQLLYIGAIKGLLCNANEYKADTHCDVVIDHSAYWYLNYFPVTLHCSNLRATV